MNSKQIQDNIDYTCKIMQQVHMLKPDQLRDNLRRSIRIARDAMEKQLQVREALFILMSCVDGSDPDIKQCEVIEAVELACKVLGVREGE